MEFYEYGFMTNISNSWIGEQDWIGSTVGFIFTFIPSLFHWVFLFFAWLTICQAAFSILDLATEFVFYVIKEIKHSSVKNEIGQWSRTQNEIIKREQQKDTDNSVDTDPAFLVRKKNLLGKIKKHRDSITAGHSINLRQFACATPDSKLFSTDENKNIWNCYDSLLQSDPQNVHELEETEWMFNNGKLRTQKELCERHRFLKKRKFLEEQFSFEQAKLLSRKMVSNDRYNDFIWIFALVIAVIIFIWYEAGMEFYPYKAFEEVVLSHCDEPLNEKLKYLQIFYRITMTYGLTFGLHCLIGLILSFLIVSIPKLGTSYEIDSESKKLYEKAGQKPPLITDSVILAGTYALTVLSIYNIFKEKKK